VFTVDKWHMMSTVQSASVHQSHAGLLSLTNNTISPWLATHNLSPCYMECSYQTQLYRHWFHKLDNVQLRPNLTS